MSNRIPAEAFEYYVSLGSDRSYRAVAERYTVTKRAIVKHAKAEKWSDRLVRIQQDAREEIDRKAAKAIVEMHELHVTMLKAMGTRAMMGLKEHPITSGMDSIRAAEAVIKLGRLLMGEPSERTEVSVEEITKREMARWLVIPGGDANAGDDDEKPPEAAPAL